MSESTAVEVPMSDWLRLADPRQLFGTSWATEWQKTVVIITDYMPPFPRADTRPRTVVSWRGANTTWFLRWSHGPVQGYFWDAYGDDFLNLTLAMRAILFCDEPPSWRIERADAARALTQIEQEGK